MTKVLLIPTNGVGLGHLTRSMAIARRLPDAIDPVFFTTSPAIDVIRSEGFYAEYFPSREQTAMNIRTWDSHFGSRLQSIIETYDPSAIVFDGSYPYGGLRRAIKRSPHRSFVWLRRGMMPPDAGARALEASPFFDTIIEPGELAVAGDGGIPADDQESALSVPPILYCDRDERLSRPEAERALGLAPGRTNVLIQLGAGSINDIGALVSGCLAELRHEADVQIALAESPIAGHSPTLAGGIVSVRKFPLSKFLSAFDFAVSAAGYNSFHELIAGAVPALFIPNPNTPLDDQVARARYAEQVRVARSWENGRIEDLRRYLADLLDRESREEMVSRMHELRFENGAPKAAGAIAEIAAEAGQPQPRITAKRRVGPIGTRALFVPINGIGLGHLTRSMAIARRLPDAIDPVFFTTSPAIDVIRGEGFYAEYFPPEPYLSLKASAWNELFGDRLESVFETYDPRVVVFDGTYPYGGLRRALKRSPQRKFVWLRGRMWQPNIGARNLRASSLFSVIVALGELGAAADRGVTAADQEGVLSVPPILYCDRDERLSRPEAERALGLAPGRTNVLIQLGAGNINDIGALVSGCIAELRREEGVQIALAESPIAAEPLALAGGIVSVRKFPLSKFLSAFDFAVSAAGYNSFHELIAGGVPTLLVPNRDTQLDDQIARARYAEQVGVARSWENGRIEDLRRYLADLLDRESREEMVSRMHELRFENGAPKAAGAIAALFSPVSELRPRSDVRSITAPAARVGSGTGNL